MSASCRSIAPHKENTFFFTLVITCALVDIGNWRQLLACLGVLTCVSNAQAHALSIGEPAYGYQ